jgi:farnesyl-diphosphate farnesyltransferase
VIAQISERIGTGMAKFITTEVETISDYNEYCHYAAGLAGLGLSRLFYASGLEEFPPDILSNSMGLFIQKTNVTRDYLEDINKSSAPRMFWPREIWGKYVERLEVSMHQTLAYNPCLSLCPCCYHYPVDSMAVNLQDFKYDEYAEVAVECLNEMVTNALSHTVDCLQYMAALQEMTNLRFCAMPQIMAMGTLAMCYNNIQVFRGVVKIRSGLMAQILEVKTMQDVYGAFFDFSRTLAAKIDKKDPSASLTCKYIEDLQTVCKAELGSRRIFAIESRGGHEACLGLALLVILVAMLLIVWR